MAKARPPSDPPALGKIIMTVVPPPDFAALDSLRDAVPADLILTEAEDMARFGHDWSGDHSGRPLAVARPRNVSDVSLIMTQCARLRIPVVPQGGLTGLVGAAVPSDQAELVMSLERMNSVRRVDPLDFAMIVEAGCVLEVAKQAADAAGCLLPHHLRRARQLPDRRQCRDQCRRLQRAALRHDT